jgi:hypothetical protein
MERAYERLSDDIEQRTVDEVERVDQREDDEDIVSVRSGPKTGASGSDGADIFNCSSQVKPPLVSAGYFGPRVIFYRPVLYFAPAPRTTGKLHLAKNRARKLKLTQGY